MRTLCTHSWTLVWVCCASIHTYGWVVFFRCMCVCAHVCLFVFVSSVNYLQHWQCLSIVDGNGKYVSLWLFFSGNLIQHLSTEKTLPRSHLITHMLLCMWNSANTAFLQTHIPPWVVQICGGVGDLFMVWQVGWWDYCSQPTLLDLYLSLSVCFHLPFSLPSKHSVQPASLLVRSFSV